ncbi:MAG: hypothetical protein FWB78_10465 [Treponema sp.]|nr:hypothetical protein [Treponema sp.]
MAEKSLNEWDDFIEFTQNAEDAAHEKFNLEEALRWLNKDLPVRRTDEELGNAIAKRARELKTTEDAVRQDLETALGELGQATVKRWLTPKINISKEEAIKVALFLQMPSEKTGEFLRRCQFYKTDKELGDAIDERALDLLEDTQVARIKEAKAAVIKTETTLKKVKASSIESKVTAEEAEAAAKEAKTALKEAKAALKKDLEEELGEQNVKKWLSPRSDIGRDKAIAIAFALRMTYEEADEFLSRLWLDKFHMRNVVDVICRYGLKNGWTYEETSKMIEAFSYLDHYNPDPDITDIAVRNATRKDGLTSYLNSKFPNSSTPEELEAFIRKNEQYFGSFRRTAHVKFMKFFDKIKGGIESEREGLAAYSAEEEMEIIRRKIVGNMHDIANGNFNPIFLELITARIPARQKHLSDIVKKHEGGTIQVDKKLLSLTWLACPSGDINLFQRGKTAHDNFCEHVLELNKSVLRPCGMADIDSRHPFDWIILNALHVSHTQYKKNEDPLGDSSIHAKDTLQKTFERMEAMEL